jgi:beta-glucosidase/6-phospho-beta-glucosidase/beta-galactosidase
VEHVVQRYGDRVDHWVTINEPMAYLIAGYVFGVFPPGLAFQPYEERVLPVLRNLIGAHALAYDAIHTRDTTDADGDDAAAVVGFSQSVAWYEPAVPGQPDHEEAAQQGELAMNYLFVDALVQGGLDTDVDGTLDETHDEWKGKLDYLGLQYYYRSPTVKLELMPPLFFAPCVGKGNELIPGIMQQLGCPDPDPNELTLMGYEHNPEGLYRVLKAFAGRYPELPLMITENGISTRSGRRRAESIVRHLEWVHRAVQEGIDLRGYYHWALIDNFEWAEGYHQPFGLYRVDFQTFERSPTEGATLYGEIARTGRISAEQRSEYGGSGPLSPEVP